MLENESFLSRRANFVWSGRPIKKLSIILRFKSYTRKIKYIRTRCFSQKRKRILNSYSYNLGVLGYVSRIEYDPVRSSYISVIVFKNNICSYSINIDNVYINDIVISSLSYFKNSKIIYKRGFSTQLCTIPVGSIISLVENNSRLGSVYSRSSGTYSILIRKEPDVKKCVVRLSSGILKKIDHFSFGTIGSISNKKKMYQKYYKAGQRVWKGYRPMVRGVAKNPVDHSHGGGEGKRSKDAFPKTFWGKKLKWRKTSRI